MLRMRSVAAFAVAAGVAAGCNGSTSAAVDPSPSPTAATAAPSPSPRPSPSPSPTEVLPANDVEDPVAALEAIVRYRDWLFENPDPDKLELIYAERCTCYEEVHAALVEGHQKRWRFDFERPRTVTGVEVVSTEGPVARLRYRFDTPPAIVFDADGAVVQKIEAETTLVTEENYLVREGGRWLVVAVV